MGTPSSACTPGGLGAHERALLVDAGEQLFGEIAPQPELGLGERLQAGQRGARLPWPGAGMETGVGQAKPACWARIRNWNCSAAARRTRPPRRAGRPLWGWESLTEAEHRVAGLVAQGLTNPQTAKRLFLSRHTIDFHLRQIFRRLDVASRVELTRVVLGHQNQP